jgi:hypothetical protein
MRAALHLLVLCALAPGMLLPASTALCFCSALDCGACAGCCQTPLGAPACDDSADACCSSDRASGPSTDGPRIGARQHCRGCVLLEAARQETTRPRAHDDGRPEFLLPAASIEVCAATAAWSSSAPEPEPLGNAPPDRARSFPLVI